MVMECYKLFNEDGVTTVGDLKEKLANYPNNFMVIINGDDTRNLYFAADPTMGFVGIFDKANIEKFTQTIDINELILDKPMPSGIDWESYFSSPEFQQSMEDTVKEYNARLGESRLEKKEE